MRRRTQTAGSGEAFQAINITPFTDVLLVLLIIFLIAGSSLSRSGLGVDRVSEPGGGSTEVAEGSMLVVQPDGALLLFREGGEPVAFDLDSADRTQAWELSAEPRARAQVVVGAYDRLLRAGFREVSFGPPVAGSLSDET